MMHIINVHQKEEWRTYIKRSLHHDFYHTWHYHSLDKTGESILFVYEENDDFIAFPLIKRIIPDSSMFDLTSVYGYPGPVSNKEFEDLGEDFLNRFKSSFLKYLREEECVSVFSRLNPFIKSEVLMEKFGGVYFNGKTVAIDLTVPVEVQRSNYKKSVRYFIKKAKRKEYYVKEARSLFEIHLFAHMYKKNMGRVNASDSYYFDLPYFIEMLKSKEFDCRLYLVYNGEEAISGALVTYTKGIVQVHLLSTLYEYLQDSPAKFLIDEITLVARTEGMKYCHLGGGVGFKEDSLFEWKTSFSNLLLSYTSWRFIADEPTYNSLLFKLGIESHDSYDFFPLYRGPVSEEIS